MTAHYVNVYPQWQTPNPHRWHWHCTCGAHGSAPDQATACTDAHQHQIRTFDVRNDTTAITLTEGTTTR